MASSNRIIFRRPYLVIYSLILVLICSTKPSSIFHLIRTITHLLSKNGQTPKHYSSSVIYSNVKKGAFFYSISMVSVSTTVTFASHSSFRELATAITHHWKPFLASIVAAIIFPAILRPPSIGSPLFGTYFTVTLIHALFVVYFSVKLVTMPMLKEKFGHNMEVPRKYSRRKFIFWHIMMVTMIIVKLYLSKEAYKLQLVFGIVGEVIHLIWLASGYELTVFNELIFEKKKKKLDEEAGTSRSQESTELLALLLDERLP